MAASNDHCPSRRITASPMNAEQLLTHFDRIADAPDAVPRLQRFILDLAVRGKLVEQDPNDEPAVELFKRIATEKERLAKAGEIKKRKPFASVEQGEQPFVAPVRTYRETLQLFDRKTRLPFSAGSSLLSPTLTVSPTSPASAVPGVISRSFADIRQISEAPKRSDQGSLGDKNVSTKPRGEVTEAPLGGVSRRSWSPVTSCPCGWLASNAHR